MIDIAKLRARCVMRRLLARITATAGFDYSMSGRRMRICPDAETMVAKLMAHNLPKPTTKRLLKPRAAESLGPDAPLTPEVEIEIRAAEIALCPGELLMSEEERRGFRAASWYERFRDREFETETLDTGLQTAGPEFWAGWLAWVIVMHEDES